MWLKCGRVSWGIELKMGIRCISIFLLYFSLRQEELKDNGPAVQFSDFTLYGADRRPLDLSPAMGVVAACRGAGFSEVGEDFHLAVRGSSTTPGF